jgi:nucleotide-binding universal stress UspA family protein
MVRGGECRDVVNRSHTMNLAFKQILVATDFSEPSELALEYAHTLARKFGAALAVVHVVEEPFPIASEFSPADVASYRTRLVDEATRELSGAVSALTDVPVRAEVVVGSTAQGIVEAATERGADLIVMGTRGRGAVATLLMGSVAERVVRTADCPVLTVHRSRAAAEECARLGT